MARWVAVAIGVVAVVVGLTSEYVRQVWIQPLWVPLIDLAIGQMLVWCGLVAAVARPQQPAGRRLVLAGFLWILGAPRQWFPSQGMTDDFLQVDAISFALVGWSDAVLAFVALSFAERWPVRGRDRAITVGLVAVCAFQTLTRVEARADVLFGVEVPDAVFTAAVVANILIISTLAIAGILIVQRWLAASRTSRYLLGPVLLAGAAAALVPIYGLWYPLSELGLIDPLPDDAAVPGFWVTNAVRMLVPVAMLVGILRQRGSRAAVASAIASMGPATSSTELEIALGQALKDPTMRVLAWDAETSAYIDGQGMPTTLPETEASTSATFVAGPDGPLGALIHDRSLAQDPTLLAAGISVTRLVMDNGRLNRELQRQLDEVRASRSRIVESGDAERRRIERDLHDGVQQRLLALALSLRRAAAHAHDPSAEDALREGADEALGVVSDVRELAQGIHPAVLTEAGLTAALRALAARSAVPVELDIDIEDVTDPTAAATAYFVASEALANVAKHSAASAASIQALEREGVIHIEVEDDGRGGADPLGAGLRGLEDRLAAVGGTLSVSERPGGGTIISAGIPAR